MDIRSVINAIEDFAPRALQEDYDNSGLQAGDVTNICTGVLLTLDVTKETVEEAKENNFDFIVSHHPILFKGIKSITPTSDIGGILIDAIKHNISIYSAHTSLDNARFGVSYRMACKLGLSNIRTLQAQTDKLCKLVVFVPTAYAKSVKQALAKSGAGEIGNYRGCSYSMDGIGAYEATVDAHPFVGEIGALHEERETRIEVILPKQLLSQTLKAMMDAHPYEEPAYDIIPLLNDDAYSGSGAIGTLPEPMTLTDFLKSLKCVFKCPCIRHNGHDGNQLVRKVALCGGSGSFLTNDAIRQGADIFITGDVKYHDFTSVDKQITVADIGHYESEQCAKEILQDVISKKFPQLKIQQSKTENNTIKYF